MNAEHDMADTDGLIDSNDSQPTILKPDANQ